MARLAAAVPLGGFDSAEQRPRWSALPKGGPLGGAPTRDLARQADGSRETARPKSAAGRDPDATLRGNPIEHGNIRVIESGGQARHCATGLRHHDLRMRDRR
jgi:hypothetical protein